MFLMHKDIPVADVTVIDGTIIDVNKILNVEHYPVGAMSKYPQLAGKFLDNWQKTRAIPHDRQNATRIIEKTGCSLDEAAFKNMAVSLTDCYWFKNDGRLSWSDVNYHENGFSEDYAYDMIFGINGNIDFRTPDFTTDGVLKKYWLSLDGIPTLVKFGDLGEEANGKNLLSANEVVAARIAKIMEIPHVDYFPIQLGKSGEIVSGCPCFISDSNLEFVNGLQLEKEGRLKSGADLWGHMCSMGMRDFLEHMIVFDYIIGNTDRHTKNFGVIRDPDTLEIKFAAPLFDSGSSFGWNGEYNISKIVTKPFRDNANDQLALVSNFPNNIPDFKEISRIIEDVYLGFSISEQQCEKAKRMVQHNMETMFLKKEKELIFITGDDIEL